MAVRFQLRRDTAANWAASNPILALGEPGVETNTLKVKVGDGTTAWNSLAYSITKDFNDLTNTPTTIAGYNISDGLTLTALSVTQNAANGTGALTYNNTTGVFEYTPPNFQDLDGNFTGSVFADNSTVMVDGVSATLNFINNDTDDLAEGSTNQYFTTARARAAISAGTGITITDGEIATTITQYTDTDAQAAITGGTGVTVTSGEVAIGQAVGTTDDVTFNSVTGNVFTSLIDSSDSSAITITPDLVLSAGLTIGNHIIPSSNENIDLGSATNRFRDLYLSGNSAIIGDLALKRHVSGGLLVADHSTGDPTNITTHNITANDVTAAGNVDVTGNLTMTGYIAGPASFVIDPAAVGDNTGTVVIAGDLQVDGTTTTINSTTLEVDDKNIVLSSGSPNAAGSDGAGITVDNGSDADATILYDGINDEWEINKDLDVTGDIVVSGTVDGRNVATDGSKLDGIEENADVTDTANVTAAGALMDSELTNIAAVKALDQGVATTDTVTFAGVSTDEFDLSAIDASIADTAVDVFIYDTRKDSDGGAWRKRTQHTSWYNETLNTATRGSRREFPAVAVIVAESNQVTIYDGDDPDMPMWMVFDSPDTDPATYAIVKSAGQSISSTIALDGILATSVSFNGLFYQKFVSDSCLRVNTANTIEGGNIASRNGGMNFSNTVGVGGIVHATANDVAITVLPNAPIDSATGLPIPTIAVATAGGVSVIKDDGTVVDSAATNAFGVITANEDGFAYGYTTFENYVVVSYETATSADGWSPDIANIYYGGSGGMSPLATAHNSTNATDALVEYSQANNLGITNWDVSGSGTYGNLFNYITSSYNTGWMNGDIKLATLSDTDDTDVTGSELVTNGTFDTDTSGWSTHLGSSSVVSGKAQLDANSTTDSNFTTSITCVVGETYVLSADAFRVSGSQSYGIAVSTSSGSNFVANNIAIVGSQTNTTEETKVITFVATATTHYVGLQVNFVNATSVFSLDNVSVRLAEEDRSVNNNGLQVFGTVTKNPVATGADLVAYTDFVDDTNYLFQPPNSDMDFGTGDFSVMLWHYHEDATLDNTIYFVSGQSTGDTWQVGAAGSDQSYLWVIGGSVNARSAAGTIIHQAWTHLTYVRRNGVTEIWLNGTLIETDTDTTDLDSNEGIEIPIKSNCGDGNDLLALLRISATAPSPEQIKKIYEDEKFLFQENAQATLYGSSDAVTALAYDGTTELLHAGTSDGRSVFQGLRRIDNTTDAVTVAISASNGLVAED